MKFSIVGLVLNSSVKIQITLKSDGNNRHLTFVSKYFCSPDVTMVAMFTDIAVDFVVNVAT